MSIVYYIVALEWGQSFAQWTLELSLARIVTVLSYNNLLTFLNFVSIARHFYPCISVRIKALNGNVGIISVVYYIVSGERREYYTNVYIVREDWYRLGSKKNIDLVACD